MKLRPPPLCVMLLGRDVRVKLAGGAVTGSDGPTPRRHPARASNCPPPTPPPLLCRCLTDDNSCGVKMSSGGGGGVAV